MKKHTCTVCGWPQLSEAPRSVSGGASFEICPCCGFQHGVSDDDEGMSPAQWRAKWVEDGMPWSSASWLAPVRWSGKRQLAKAKLGS